MTGKTTQQLAEEAGFESARGEIFGPGYEPLDCSLELERFRALVLEDCARHLDARAMDSFRGDIERHNILCASTWVRDLKEKP